MEHDRINREFLFGFFRKTERNQTNHKKIVARWGRTPGKTQRNEAKAAFCWGATTNITQRNQKKTEFVGL